LSATGSRSCAEPDHGAAAGAVPASNDEVVGTGGGGGIRRLASTAAAAAASGESTCPSVAAEANRAANARWLLARSSLTWSALAPGSMTRPVSTVPCHAGDPRLSHWQMTGRECDVKAVAHFTASIRVLTRFYHYPLSVGPLNNVCSGRTVRRRGVVVPFVACHGAGGWAPRRFAATAPLGSHEKKMIPSSCAKLTKCIGKYPGCCRGCSGTIIRERPSF